MAYADMTREMIQALDEEIQAIKKDGAGHSIPLQGGIKKGHLAGRYLYAFLLGHEMVVLDDTPAQLKVGSDLYEVTVVSLEGFELTLAVPNDLGARVPAASLNLSPYYLLELLKKRLEEILSGDLKAEKRLALSLFNAQPNTKLPPGPLPDYTIIPGRSPNREQAAAVETALRQAITFIWGPPGTGKTTTINYLVPALVKRGERVFITSHTNGAVDAVMKAAIRGFTEQEIDDGAVVRIGSPKEKDPDIERITLDAVVDRKGANLRREEVIAEAQLATATQKFQKWQRWAREHQLIADLAVRAGAAHQELLTARNDVAALQQQLQAGRTTVTNLEARLHEAKTAGFFRRLFSGLNAERIEAELVVQRRRLTELVKAREKAAGSQPAKQAALDEAEQALRNARAELARLGDVPSVAETQGQIHSAQQDIKQSETLLAQIRAQLAGIAASVVRNAQVLGSTLSKLSSTPDLYRTAFPTVIIDEVSMIPQPHLWLASSLAASRVVVLGDFRQLPPISVADESALAKQRMATDIFTAAGILDENDRLVKDQRLVALQTQYRMHERISELANVLVYRDDGNELIPKAAEATIAPGLGAEPESGAPLVLCDTSAVNPWSARLDPSYSRYNIYTALVAARLAAEAVRDHENLRVGVIAPYSAQARLIQTLIKQHGLADSVQVATVHRFQGNEKDVVIVDLVDGPPFKPGVLLQGPKGLRLLNVAFSRAKGKLILISNCNYYDGRNAGETLARTHQYFGRHARALDSRTLLADYGDAELLKLDPQLRRGREMGNPEGMSWYDESTFYDAFLRDLQTAERQVVIFSPFIYAGRTAQLIPTVRHLLDRGVAVHLLTRDERGESSGDRQQLLQELKALGVKLTARKGLHEKVAFIDERIAWTGSLNIFSQSWSTEQMLRFANPDVAGKLLELSGVGFLLRQQQRREDRQALLERLLEVLPTYMHVPNCPRCRRTMVMRTGQFGPFFGCQGYRDGCDQIVNIPRPTLKAMVDELNIPCPTCEPGTMRLKWSGRGPFLGCDQYPADKTTLPLA